MSKKGEPKTDTSTIVDDLKDSDILMGRGKKSNGRPGNVRLRQLAEAKARQYKQLSTKRDKRNFSRQFIADIESTGARFLQPVSVSFQGSYKTAYMSVPRETVEIKIKQLLRDRAALLSKDAGVPDVNGVVQGTTFARAEGTNTPRRFSFHAQRSSDSPHQALSRYASLPASLLAQANPGANILLGQLELAEQAQHIQRLRELQGFDASNASTHLRANEATESSRHTEANSSEGGGISSPRRASLPTSMLSQGGSLGISYDLAMQLVRLEQARLLQRLQEQQAAAAMLLRPQHLSPMELLLAEQQLQQSQIGRGALADDSTKVPAEDLQVAHGRNREPDGSGYAEIQSTGAGRSDKPPREIKNPPPDLRKKPPDQS